MSKIQPLAKGALILQEKPFAYIVKSKYIKERCDFCLSSGKLMKCGGCQHSHYCGVLCQRDAWAEHKYECLCMKKIAPRMIPDAARMMAKIIWKLQYGGYLTKFYYSRNGFRKFIDLMAHMSDIKWDKNRMEHVECLYAVLKEYLAAEHVPNYTEFLGIYGRLCINGFNLLDDEQNSIGTAIYLATSILDHSCKPNAVATFDGPEISIRLIEDIPELDWSKIKISYIDVLNLPAERRAELKSSYYFDCDCERCKDETLEPKMLAAACPKAECDNPIIAGVEKCQSCYALISEEYWENFNEVMEMTKEKLQEMRETRYIDMCILLDKRQRGVLHADNVYRLKTLDMALDVAIDFQRWDEAIQFGKALMPGLTKYTFPNNPLLGIIQLKLGKIYLYLDQLQLAIHHFREAADVLKITYGENSRLIKDKLNPLLVEAQKKIVEAQRLKDERDAAAEDEDEDEEEEAATP